MGAVGHTKLVNDSPRRPRITTGPRTNFHSYFAKYHKQLTKRAKRRNLGCSLTSKDLYDLYLKQHGKCAITRIDMTANVSSGQWNTYNISVDRIDNSVGYHVGNVHLVCQHINIMRGTLSIDDFLELCREIVKRTSK